MVGVLRTASVVSDLVSKHYTASSRSFAKVARVGLEEREGSNAAFLVVPT
jgi:hypothetical protein